MSIHSLYRFSLYCTAAVFTLLVTLFVTACNGPPNPPVDIAPGEKRTFTGTWSATGQYQAMQLEQDRRVVTFRLTGSLLLEGKQRLRKGFKADLIGFSDTKSGMLGRSVWTDEKGDKVYSEVQGTAKTPGELISGTFLGGTGRYSNVRGTYSFRWQNVNTTKHGQMSGRTVDLNGWAILGAPETLPNTGDGQP